MAARKRRIRHDEDTRAKIQASQLINRLTDHALGKNEMTATQVQAARILLDRTLPALSQVEYTGEVEHSYVIHAPQPFESTEEWAQKHSIQ